MINNGFLYVASLNKAFIISARYSAFSLKEQWPDSHITLFTHQEWIEECLDEIRNFFIGKFCELSGWRIPFEYKDWPILEVGCLPLLLEKHRI